MNTKKLFCLIKESKSGNPDSMSELIENFDLFLKANAKKTGREDGYNELVNSFIDFIRQFPLENFDPDSNIKISFYLKTVVRNKTYEYSQEQRCVKI